MRYHLFLPQMRMTHDQIVERALAAEAAGFEGVAFMDHLAFSLGKRPQNSTQLDRFFALAFTRWRSSSLSTGSGCVSRSKIASSSSSMPSRTARSSSSVSVWDSAIRWRRYSSMFTLPAL